MKRRTLIVRIVAIVLCALMVLGIVGGAISIFAADGCCPAQTGSSSQAIPIVLGVLAALLVVACVVIPKLKKTPVPSPEQPQNVVPEQQKNEAENEIKD